MGFVIDRFHVTRNYREDFDKVRKQERHRLRQSLPEAADMVSPHQFGYNQQQ